MIKSNISYPYPYNGKELLSTSKDIIWYVNIDRAIEAEALGATVMNRRVLNETVFQIFCNIFKLHSWLSFLSSIDEFYAAQLHLSCATTLHILIDKESETPSSIFCTPDSDIPAETAHSCSCVNNDSQLL